nr:MAG TPA: hypothetical protein [Caudoviricetes sp.]
MSDSRGNCRRGYIILFLFFFLKRDYLKKQKKNRAFVQKYCCFLISI